MPFNYVSEFDCVFRSWYTSFIGGTIFWTKGRTKMRTYQETHPWITFHFDFQHVDYKIWLLLGRAQAKCTYVSKAPIAPDISEELRLVFLTKGALATTAIEGNTLTEDQVRQRLEGQLKLPPSQEYLGREIDNIVEAYNHIGDEILAGTGSQFTVERIKRYNELVLKNLPVNDDVELGEIRQHSVSVGPYLGAPPEDCEYLLDKLCEWLNTDLGAPEGYEIAFEILRAIIAHLYFAWIHPFADGNGRTARLIEFEILLRAGVPDIAAHLMSNHYNKTRTEYYRQLDLSSKSGGNIFGFIMYALQGLVDGLGEQLKLIQDHQLQVQWRQYVFREFANKDNKPAIRRRNLLLDLSDMYFSIGGTSNYGKAGPVRINMIRGLTPRLAEAYAGKNDRMVMRDLKLLQEEEFIVFNRNYVMPRFDRLNTFLPRKRTNLTDQG